MADSSIVIKINGDVKGFQNALEAAKAETENLEGSLQQIGKVSAVAFAALTAEIGFAVKAYGESEAATNKLTAAIRNQGLSSEVLVASYKQQAAELQKLTGVDDDAIVSGQAYLQTVIGQTEVTKEMSQAALDLGAAMGGDVQTGFQALGRAIAGQDRALKQFGIEIDQNISKQERTEQILSKVAVKLGGQAEAANKGVGSIKGLHSAFGDFQEEIGRNFAPIFERAVKALTQFFQRAADNKELMAMISGLLAAGATVTGLIAGMAGLGQTLVFLKAGMAAFGAASGIALGPLALIAGALAAIAGAAAYFAVNTKNATDRVNEMKQKVKETEDGIKQLQAIANSGVKSVFSEQAKADLERATQKLAEYKLALEDARKAESLESSTARDKATDPAKVSAANEEAARKAEEDRNIAAAREAQRELELAKLTGAGQEELRVRSEIAELRNQMISEKDGELLAIKRERLEELQSLENEFNQISDEELDIRYQEKLALDDEKHKLAMETEALHRQELIDQAAAYDALSAEQKAIISEAEFNQLNSRKMTEKEALKKHETDKILAQNQSHNQLLQDQIKYGKAYALINQAMHSEVYQGTKSALNEMTAFQQSKNAELKAIGKAAAVASIIMNTAQSAMNIFNGFATIPIVGYALGVAGAAAAVAFGAEQIGRVNSAADGGLLTGGIPGKDSIPVMAMPGEVVTPTRNFEEVIGSVRAKREADKLGGGSPFDSPQGTQILVGFDGNEASQVITIKQIEDRALGISRESS